MLLILGLHQRRECVFVREFGCLKLRLRLRLSLFLRQPIGFTKEHRGRATVPGDSDSDSGWVSLTASVENESDSQRRRRAGSLRSTACLACFPHSIIQLELVPSYAVILLHAVRRSYCRYFFPIPLRWAQSNTTTVAHADLNPFCKAEEYLSSWPRGDSRLMRRR